MICWFKPIDWFIWGLWLGHWDSVNVKINLYRNDWMVGLMRKQPLIEGVSAILFFVQRCQRCLCLDPRLFREVIMTQLFWFWNFFCPERLKVAFGPGAIQRHSSENSFHAQDESGSRDTSERKLPKLTDGYDDILLFMHSSLKAF